MAEIYFQFNEVHRIVFVERSKTSSLYAVEHNCGIPQSETLC